VVLLFDGHSTHVPTLTLGNTKRWKPPAGFHTPFPFFDWWFFGNAVKYTYLSRSRHKRPVVLAARCKKITSKGYGDWAKKLASIAH
jgi:hypothetical protein